MNKSLLYENVRQRTNVVLKRTYILLSDIVNLLCIKVLSVWHIFCNIKYKNNVSEVCGKMNKIIGEKIF